MRHRLRLLLYAALVLLYVLHNDLWLWDDPTLIGGFPVGLLYHVAYCLVVSLVLYVLVHYAWPFEGLAALEEERNGRE